ncbi:MAG: hypothetical protein P8I38_03215 [Arenicella sp.]|nr:hypothetical protein [Arenicella sp.]
MSDSRDGFFAVSKEVFSRVMELSVREVCAYLVIARGTGRSNTVSAWSNNAVENYTGLARSRAKAAVERLVEAGLLEKLKGGSRPQYQLMESRTEKLIEDDVYWLPNGLITGVAGETPPIEQLKETGDKMLVELLLDLYGEQNLIEDGGLQPTIYKNLHDKKVITERAQFNIWGFDMPKYSETTHGIELVEKHRDSEGAFEPFFDRIKTLHTMGLLEKTTHLMESVSGEPIVELNTQLDDSARQACEALIGEDNQMIHRLENHDYVLPVERHYKNADLVTTYRTRYKPRTKMTGGWAVERDKIQEAFQEKFLLISKGQTENIRYTDRLVQTMQHKGDMKVA